MEYGVCVCVSCVCVVCVVCAQVMSVPVPGHDISWQIGAGCALANKAIEQLSIMYRILTDEQ